MSVIASGFSSSATDDQKETARDNLDVYSKDSVDDYITELSAANNDRTKAALNASGSAPIYACRAWLNYNGVTNTINASGNILGVTDNGTGDYTVNFIENMPDTSFSVTTSSGGSVTSAQQYNCNTRNPTVSSVDIISFLGGEGSGTGGLSDNDYINISVFR